MSASDKNELEVGFPLDIAKSITYYSVLNQDNQLVTKNLPYSDTFNYFYYYASIGCWKDSDPQACQVLANLCVL